MKNKDSDDLFEFAGEPILPFDFPDDGEQSNGEEHSKEQNDNKTIEIIKEVKNDEQENVDKKTNIILENNEKEELKQDFNIKSNKKENSSIPQTKKSKTSITLKNKKEIVKNKEIQPQNIKGKKTNTVLNEKNSLNSLETKNETINTFGGILQEARVSKNYSLEQVSQTTKIKKTFIEALERGDASFLPAPIYLSAYIKTLSNFYGIQANLVLEKIETKQNNLHQNLRDLINHIEEGEQVNFQEEKKFKKTMKIIAVVLILLCIIGVGGIIIFKQTPKPQATIAKTNVKPIKANTKTNKKTNKKTILKRKTVPEKSKIISSKDLEVFIYQKPITMTELAIPNPNEM